VKNKLYSIEDVKNSELVEIDKVNALDIVFNNHYSKVMPRLTKHFLGSFIDKKLVAVLTLGWGVQPLNTIKILFPSLITKDYLEIGKMCMLEELPKNSESMILSKMFKWVKENRPDVKLIYTWADGILGKPGYVYQAANFLYGGFITTDLYLSDTGERVHPRTAQSYLKDKKDVSIGRRPNKEFLIENNWSHYRGRQFRYVYFLCDKREKKRLLKETDIKWNREYPKDGAIVWKKKDFTDGSWNNVGEIEWKSDSPLKYNKSAIKNSKVVAGYNKAKEFFDFEG
jgi:hypothetical protein